MPVGVTLAAISGVAHQAGIGVACASIGCVANQVQLRVTDALTIFVHEPSGGIAHTLPLDQDEAFSIALAGAGPTIATCRVTDTFTIHLGQPGVRVTHTVASDVHEVIGSITDTGIIVISEAVALVADTQTIHLDQPIQEVTHTLALHVDVAGVAATALGGSA